MAALVNPAVELASCLHRTTLKNLQDHDFKGVFSGRELTRKDDRLSSGLAPIDSALSGGIVRGGISEVIGPAGSGKTSLAASFMAHATRNGEVAAWLDFAGAFDPPSVAATGVDLARILWVRCGEFCRNDPDRHGQPKKLLKTAEMVIETGGFGLIVLDFDDCSFPIPQSAALRLARRAERSMTAVLVLAAQRMCGTFAALSLVLIRNRAWFNCPQPGAPVLFDGLTIEARVTRNKLGGSGCTTIWRALPDPAIQASAPAFEAKTARSLRQSPVRPKHTRQHSWGAGFDA